jgi:hypothetical protein
MRERRDDLKTLSTRLVSLHAALLESERHAYEETYGATKPAELLRLLLNDPYFAWLRPVSGIIAQIDEALEPRATTAAFDANMLFEAAQTLLRSGGSSAFQTKYRDALQKSPEVVMAHADVVKVLTRHGA